MEIDVTMLSLVLPAVALAAIAGGIVLYRGSRRVGWRAVGMSAVALGVGTLLVFAMTIPVSQEIELSSTSEAPRPEIVTETVSQSSEASTTP